MKRLSPALVLAMATAAVIMIDAVIVVVPQALADPAPWASPSSIPVVAAASPSSTPTATPTPTPTAWPYSPGPSFPLYFPTPTVKPKPTPVPTMRDTVWNARTYVQNRVGFKGYNCINAVWTAESGWNPLAGNPNGAYGIPQAFPGTKMAAFGANWRYSPLTQVKWGLWYVTNRYGSACGAYNYWEAHGWY